jgi:hypothetical protein
MKWGEVRVTGSCAAGSDIAYRREGAWTWAPTDVTPGARTVNQFLIRQYLDEVSRVFHLP